MTSRTPAGRYKAASALPYLLVLSVLSSPAAAEPVSTVQASGDPSNRLDLVFLGDGYTAAEMAKYATDVEAFLTQLFAEAPFGSYRPYFNVHRVEVVSVESGADKAPEGIFRNTALGSFYYCSNTERLICVDNVAVNSVLTRSLNVNQRDLVVILVNDTKYGGSGGQWAVASLNSQSAEIARHEIGHTLGLLADEYVDTQLTCNTSVEPIEANVTTRTDRAQIKWSAWIAGSTPIPTTTTTLGVPGLYQGGKYCAAGMYRPTFDSKMRSLGRPFEQVNTEQLVKRFYNFVSPIDDASPSDAFITAPSGSVSAFSVAVPRPDSHALQITWEVDGVQVSAASQLFVVTSVLAAGSHHVRVTVRDPTTMVRSDPTGILTETRSWTLFVQTAEQLPDPSLSDLDGDQKRDLAVYRPSAGTWHVLPSRAGSAPLTLQWGTGTDIPVPGDYDGDGKTDLAVYRPDTGIWWILFSSSSYATRLTLQWGVSTDVPMPADFDGDGRTDLAIYRPANGQWWILFSSSGYTTSRQITWGVSTDVPIAKDFDGDGRADLTAYRGNGGQWWTLFSASGYTTSRQMSGWGYATDLPVPGDFDGDRKADLAIFRPEDGHWWILYSSTGFTSWLEIAWGANDDVPVPGDFDGDRKSDIAVYRPSTGQWWILYSAAGYSERQITTWGIAFDRPVGN